MRQKISLLAFTLFSGLQFYAQNNLPPAYEIFADTAAVIWLHDVHWQMLEDPEGKWAIDDVHRPPITEKFHPNTTQTDGIFDVDYSIKTFWLRYRLQNRMMHEVRITIPKKVTQAEFYTSTFNGHWNRKTTGTLIPWSKREHLKRITTVIYVIQPGEQLLIYERDSFDYLIHTPDFYEVRFGFADSAVKDFLSEHDFLIYPSFMFGVFLLAALFNFYFFLIVRRKVYLLFSLTLLSHAFMRFLSFDLIFFKEVPMLNWLLSEVSGIFFFFFLIHFVRYFLEPLNIFGVGTNTLFG